MNASLAAEAAFPAAEADELAPRRSSRRTDAQPPLRLGRHRGRRAPRRLARDRPRPPDRRHGPVGLRQVDAHAHPRRPRPPTGGRVEIDGTDITSAERHAADEAAAPHIGFVFQFFNLLPMLTAEENVAPAALARGREARPRRGSTSCSSARASPTGASTVPPSSPAASSSASPSRARSSRGRPCSSPTSRPATSTRARAHEILELLRDAVDTYGQTIVMVTHDPRAAAIADRVLFLADGEIVRELGRCRSSTRSSRAGGGVRPMTKVALKGLAGRKLRSAADRDRDRPRRRDGQRHATSSPTRSTARSTRSSPSRTRAPTRS